MQNPVLLFARHIHNVEGEELARQLREGNVHVDFHTFTYEIGQPRANLRGKLKRGKTDRGPYQLSAQDV